MLVSPNTLQFFKRFILKFFNFLNDFSKYISGQDPVKDLKLFFFRFLIISDLIFYNFYFPFLQKNKIYTKLICIVLWDSDIKNIYYNGK